MRYGDISQPTVRQADVCTSAAPADGTGEERGGALLVAALAWRLTTGRRETANGVLFILGIWAGWVRRPEWRWGRPVAITERRLAAGACVLCPPHARCDAARTRQVGVCGGAALAARAGGAGGSRPRVESHLAPRPRVFGWVRTNPDGRREWGGSTAMACGCRRVALDVERRTAGGEALRARRERQARSQRQLRRRRRRGE